MTTEPDMTNKLGVLRRINVNKLLKYYDEHFTSLTDVAAKADLSSQTMRNSFSANPRTMPTSKTIQKLSELFSIAKGKLDRSDFDPAEDSDYCSDAATGAPIPHKKKSKRSAADLEQLPVVVQQTRIVMQIGKTNIETSVDAAIAERVLKLIILGDDI